MKLACMRAIGTYERGINLVIIGEEEEVAAVGDLSSAPRSQEERRERGMVAKAFGPAEGVGEFRSKTQKRQELSMVAVFSLPSCDVIF